MLGLVLNALRARRSQTVALFALTVLAALGAGAAPWFLGWARAAVADANITAAPAEQRVVTATGSVRYDPESEQRPTQLLRDRAGRQLTVPGAETVAGAHIYVNMARGDGDPGAEAGLHLTFREGVCAHLRLEGRCPDADGEVIVGRSVAESLGIAVGDTVVFQGFRLPAPATLTVSGVYEVIDLLSTYWAGTELLAGPIGILNTLIEDPAFVSESTLLATMPDGLDMDYQVVLPPGAYHPTQFDLARRLNDATNDLRSANLDVQTQALALVDQIRRDQRLVALGITVAAAQLVVLCWFVLFLAVRHTSEERRPDIGLMKLRGAAGWRIWTLTAQQSALPMLVGAALGWGAGFLAAAVLARELTGLAGAGEADPAATLRLSLLASGIACLGALVAAMVAEWQALRAPVVGLLRRVPARHRGWRAEVFDLVVVAVAAAGVYQGHVELEAGGELSLLALLAPGLVALAVAMVVARTLPWLAGLAGSAALRNGRAGAALAALHVARRPGTHRVFAVLAVSVSVLISTTLFWNTAARAWSDRAALAVGAERVLTVQAANSAALLAAVREADPSGMHAMAAARTAGVSTEERVLAVDTARLTAVADLSEANGIEANGIEANGMAANGTEASGTEASGTNGLADPADLAQLLHPPVAESLPVMDGAITVDARAPVDLGPQYPMSLRLEMASTDGRVSTVDIGPLSPQRNRYEASVTACAAGCRLVSAELVAPARIKESRDGTVEIYGISQGDSAVASPQVLGDVTRWRPQVGPVGIGTVIRTSDGVLTASLYTGSLPQSQRVDARVFVVDAPTPLPVLLVGDRPVARRAGDDRVTVLGAQRVPYHVIATAAVLPRLGDAGVIVDLEYAQRLMGRSGESASLEVWLSDDAPAQIVAQLEARGVRVIRDESVGAATSRLAAQGPGIALRFQLFAAAIILLLAAGTIAVTGAVERRPRIAELTALRAQGLGLPAMRVAAYAGTVALVAGGLVTGLFSAILTAAVITTQMPVFADSWSLLPLVTGPRPLPVALASLACLIILGFSATFAASRIARGVETRGVETRGVETRGADGTDAA